MRKALVLCVLFVSVQAGWAAAPPTLPEAFSLKIENWRGQDWPIFDVFLVAKTATTPKHHERLSHVETWSDSARRSFVDALYKVGSSKESSKSLTCGFSLYEVKGQRIFSIVQDKALCTSTLIALANQLYSPEDAQAREKVLTFLVTNNRPTESIDKAMKSHLIKPVSPDAPVRARLRIRSNTEAKGADVLYADLTVANASTRTWYIDPLYVETPLQSNGRFTLTSWENQPIAYIGTTAKRVESPPDKMIELAPGTSRQFSIRFGDKYAFLPGLYVYQGVYSISLSSTRQGDEPLFVDTPPVLFSYKPKPPPMP